MKTIFLVILQVLLICGSCVQWRNRHQKDDVLEIINPVVKPNTHYTLFNQDTMFAYFDDSDLILRNKLDTFNFELDYATDNFYEFYIFYNGKKRGRLGILQPVIEDEKGHEHFSFEVWFGNKGPQFLLKESTTFLPLN